MLVVRKVALAVEAVFAPERTHLLSLGSAQGNSHLHWHIAGLPPGVPYEQQKYHADDGERGARTHLRGERRHRGQVAPGDRLRARRHGTARSDRQG
ncbi:hypothetical protein ACFVYY_33350, partial [Streptomyces sp. NPDC058297]